MINNFPENIYPRADDLKVYTEYFFKNFESFKKLPLNDLFRTLTEVTAEMIFKFFVFCERPEKVIFHGGGTLNSFLMERIEKKIEKTTENKKDKSVKASSKISDRLKSSSAITKSAIGSASSAVGRGAGAVKSGIGRGAGAVSSGIGKGAGAVKSGIGKGASKVMGLFGRGSDQKEVSKKDYTKMKVAELKSELKERGLSTAGKKADLIKRLNE